MRLRCYIVDDELTSILTLCPYIEEHKDLELIGYDTDDERAISSLLKKEVIADILFLDINMPNINGIDFADKIKGTAITIIFVTSDEGYALSAFEYGIAYLVKPFDLEDFLKVTAKALQWYEGKNPELNIKGDALSIKDGRKGNYIIIQLGDVIFIESNSNYSNFTMRNGKVHVAYISIKKLVSRLDGLGFWRVHRQFIINLKFVGTVSGDTLRMGDYIIPIGPSYKDPFLTEVIRKILPG